MSTLGFSVGLSSTLQNFPPAVDIKPWSISANSTYYNGGYFDLSTGIYTVPQDGYYAVIGRIDTATGIIKIVQNGIDVGYLNTTYFFSLNDAISLRLVGSRATIIGNGSYNTFFSIFPSDNYNPSGFVGINVHLDANIDPYTPNTVISPWNDDYSSNFYTSADFDLATGIYTIPEDGYYNIEAASNNDIAAFINNTVYQSNIEAALQRMINITMYFSLGDTITLKSTDATAILKLNAGAPGGIGTYWTITKQGGPQGDPGPIGNTGPTGFTGPTGSPGLLTLLDSVVLGATASSIDFNAISGSYNNLKITFLGQTDYVAPDPFFGFPQLIINGDTGGNYNWLQGYFFFAGGAVAGFYEAQNYYQLGGVNASNDGLGKGSNISIDIFEYTNTTFSKGIISSSAALTTSTGFSFYTHGSWGSLSAITSLSILSGGGSFIPGTTARLYAW
jgi:hypothetical protein